MIYFLNMIVDLPISMLGKWVWMLPAKICRLFSLRAHHCNGLQCRHQAWLAAKKIALQNPLHKKFICSTVLVRVLEGLHPNFWYFGRGYIRVLLAPSTPWDPWRLRFVQWLGPLSSCVSFCYAHEPTINPTVRIWVPFTNWEIPFVGTAESR